MSISGKPTIEMYASARVGQVPFWVISRKSLEVFMTIVLDPSLHAVTQSVKVQCASHQTSSKFVSEMDQIQTILQKYVAVGDDTKDKLLGAEFMVISKDGMCFLCTP